VGESAYDKFSAEFIGEKQRTRKGEEAECM
jgi:hypothetical protein